MLLILVKLLSCSISGKLKHYSDDLMHKLIMMPHLKKNVWCNDGKKMVDNKTALYQNIKKECIWYWNLWKVKYFIFVFYVFSLPIEENTEHFCGSKKIL